MDAKTYNILLGRASLNKLGAIVSTSHLAMKFPLESKRRDKDIVTLHVDQKIARECYAKSLRIPLNTNRETRGSSSNHYE